MAPLLPGRDYMHWFIGMMEPSGQGATKQQMIDCYIQTLAKVLESEEEAKKKIYNVSCEGYLGFGCEIDEETSNKLKGNMGKAKEDDEIVKHRNAFRDKLNNIKTKIDQHLRKMGEDEDKDKDKDPFIKHYLARINSSGTRENQVAPQHYLLSEISVQTRLQTLNESNQALKKAEGELKNDNDMN
ncbi:hypothetical protein RJT34_23472 [Clitoria ternatea]|uniref:MORF/ORRM1/DAG-like MORF domain-containing protein n=1 Tax=Clitoria ternatea TaxID=43366 RepID=A0AAN9FSV3_CLITE